MVPNDAFVGLMPLDRVEFFSTSYGLCELTALTETVDSPDIIPLPSKGTSKDGVGHSVRSHRVSKMR